MDADQSASVNRSASIKGRCLLRPRSHYCCGCKGSEGLRCWSRVIAETQRHPTMQNYQQNSYNINAGYYINLLTVGYNLPAVLCRYKCARRSLYTKDIRHCWQCFVVIIRYIRNVFVYNTVFFSNVTCEKSLRRQWILWLWCSFNVLVVLSVVFVVEWWTYQNCWC